MKNIFVGNLDFGVREEAVRSLFETYGTVERVSIMTDRADPSAVTSLRQLEEERWDHSGTTSRT